MSDFEHLSEYERPFRDSATHTSTEFRLYIQAMKNRPNPADLDTTIQFWENKLETWEPYLAQSASPDQALQLHLVALSSASSAYLRRYQVQGEIQDLRQGLALLQEAVELAPLESSNLPHYLSTLEYGMMTLYARTESQGDVGSAYHFWEAVRSQVAGRPALLASVLNNLGYWLTERSRFSGSRVDLDRALACCEEAIRLCLPGSSNLGRYLMNLGSALRCRFEADGVLEDLEQSLEVGEQAIERTPRDASNYPRALTNQGYGLRDRYRATGNLQDLERAVKCWREAATLFSPQAPELARVQVAILEGLKERYERVGSES